MPSTHPNEPETFVFGDDGSIPNNPKLPFLVYRGIIDLKGNPDPEDLVERTFAGNQWGEMWRNGIYRYVHYHSMIHEAMGLARGRARVRFGGNAGIELELHAGDVCVLPAGTGHQSLWSSSDLMVIGAYPPSGKYDLCRGSKSEHARAISVIPDVPVPPTDPVYGKAGPLIRLWQS
ncbi:MAG TPA: hypothetical protein VFU97_20730 [Xanthobacteraceae bacterium]|nr:hypothetical protein [Xanthobacteraceae bacterium]